MPEPDRVVVSDTGPFITLERLPGGFALLRQLYDRVLLPEQVLDGLLAALRESAERPNPNGTVFSDSFEESSPSLPFSDLIQRPPGHSSLGLLLVVPKLIEFLSAPCAG